MSTKGNAMTQPPNAPQLGIRSRALGSEESIAHLLKPQWLVRDVVPAMGTQLCVGQKNSGKTAFMIELAMSVAARRPTFCGRSIRVPEFQQVVVFIDGEGDELVFQRRARAIQNAKRWPQDQIGAVSQNLHYYSFPAAFLYGGSLQSELMAAYKPGEVALIVLDTYRRLSGVEDANDESQASIAIAQANQISFRFGCPVLIPSHANREDRKGGRKVNTAMTRGSSAVTDQAYTNSVIWRSEDRATSYFQLSESRDAPILPQRLMFCVSSYHLGNDLNGDGVTAAYMDDPHWEDASKSTGGAAHRVLNALAENDGEFGSMGALGAALDLDAAQVSRLFSAAVTEQPDWFETFKNGKAKGLRLKQQEQT